MLDNSKNHDMPSQVSELLHKAKSPLTAIIGYADMLHMNLEKSESPTDQRKLSEWAHTIKQEAHRINELLDKIKEVTTK